MCPSVMISRSLTAGAWFSTSQFSVVSPVAFRQSNGMSGTHALVKASMKLNWWRGSVRNPLSAPMDTPAPTVSMTKRSTPARAIRR